MATAPQRRLKGTDRIPFARLTGLSGLASGSALEAVGRAGSSLPRSSDDEPNAEPPAVSHGLAMTRVDRS